MKYFVQFTHVRITGPDWKGKSQYLSGVSKDGDKFYFSKHKKDAIRVTVENARYVKKEIAKSRPDLIVLI